VPSWVELRGNSGPIASSVRGSIAGSGEIFHPSKAVENKRKHAGSIAEFYIISLEEMKALLAYANSRFALAA